MSAQALRDQLAAMPVRLGQPGAAWARWQAARALARYSDAEVMLSEFGARLPPRRQMSMIQDVAITAGWARARLQMRSLPITSELARFLLLLSERRALVDAHLGELDATFCLSACSELQVDIDQVGRVLAAARTWWPPAGLRRRLGEVLLLREWEAILIVLQSRSGQRLALGRGLANLRLVIVRRCLRLIAALHEDLGQDPPKRGSGRRAQHWRQALGPIGDRLVGALADEAEALSVREKWLASAAAAPPSRPDSA